LSGSDQLPFTQEFLAEMLGVRRTSVTSVARTLHEAGIINTPAARSKYSMLKVCKNTACECYEPIKEQYGQLPGVPSFAIVGLRRQAANTLRGAGLKQFLSVSCNFGSLLLSLKRFDSGFPEPTALCPLPGYP
jgi:hypothetical protein